jgi:hypothetical protein
VITEYCGCGAKFEMDDRRMQDNCVPRWQHTRETFAVEQWRANHRHEPAPAEMSDDVEAVVKHAADLLVHRIEQLKKDREIAAELTRQVQADPLCPFPMGAKVRITCHGHDEYNRVGTVTDWFYSPVDELWFVRLDNEIGFNGKPTGWVPENLELVPDPPTTSTVTTTTLSALPYWDSVENPVYDTDLSTGGRTPIPPSDGDTTSVAPAGRTTGHTDEPPAGTPVWWDGKWWISDERGAAYTPTLWADRDLVKFWKFMPGAVPALTPEQVERRSGKDVMAGYDAGRSVAACDVATEFGAPKPPWRFSPGSAADRAVRAARGERSE